MPPRSALAPTHDDLTGLPNRGCVDELARALALDAKSDLTVVLIGLPDLNDDIRRIIAQRVRACARGDDVVARISEDCFAMLLTPRLAPNEEAKLLARLRTAVGADVLGFAAGFGIAHCPEDGTSLDALLAHASQPLRSETAH